MGGWNKMPEALRRGGGSSITCVYQQAFNGMIHSPIYMMNDPKGGINSSNRRVNSSWINNN